MSATSAAAYKASAAGEESLKCQLERIRNGLVEGRAVYLPLWRDLADNFLPFRGRWLNEKPGQAIRRNLKIINETPLIAQRTFGAGMQAGVTSPSRPWFRLKTVDKALLEEEGVTEWLYTVEGEMRDMFARSNFYPSMRACYSEYGVFGTLALGIYDELEKGIHCCPYTIGSYYVSINEKGQVDTFCQDFKWTVRQVVQRWVKDPKNPKDPGWQNISDTVRQAWERKQRETWVDLVYIVMPNNDRQLGRLDAKGMPFIAVYYESGDKQSEKILEQKGFREFPVMVARVATNEGESYGNGLGVDALGSAKALQLQEKRKAQVIDKEVDPPMKGHPSLRNQKASQLPGDITYVEPSVGNVGFEPVSQWKPDRSGMLEDIASIEQRINTILFADIFALFIQGENEQETATRTAAKQQEKLLMLGPVLEGINHELLNPAIDRVFAIGARQGRFPPPPEALQGQPLKVEYVSILAQAQNALTVQGVQQFTGFVLGLAAQQAEMGQEPTALDKIDVDQVCDEFANLSGVVPTIVLNDARVKEIRDQRAQAKAAALKQQQMMEAIPAGAKAAKDLAQAPLGENSALDAVAGTMQ